MGFWEKLLALFFGKGKKSEKAVQLRLSEVECFCAKHAEKSREELLRVSAGKTAEIKHLLSELHSALDALEEAESAGGNKRRDQIVETARQNTLRQLGVLVERLQPPQPAGIAKMREYCDEGIVLLNKGIPMFGKNIAYTSVSFKGEIKRLGESFNELQRCLGELRRAFAEHNSVFLLEKVSGLLQEIATAEEKANAAMRDSEIASTDAQRLQEKIAAKESALRELREGSEFKGIAALEEQKAVLARQKQDAKTEVLNLFANIEKPLHRMEKAVAGRKVFLDKRHAEFLGQLLLNPFAALKGDPKGETMKAVLKATLGAVESGAIELKEKEREKRVAALRELLGFDFFSGVFWRFNEIDAGLVAVEKKLAEHPMGKKESKLLAEINDLLGLLEGKKSLAVEWKAAFERLLGSQRGLHSQLESLVSEVAGAKVSIKP
ncbi:MAG: hypothetical protein NTW59_00750 [Candidatus Diapherotrites archaeon]|nr:hypothetical protein [Candidatus Diapherotrites archaeon]